MDSTFDRCYPWIRESEGRNDDDPADPGGRTSRGITQREYNAWCLSCGTPQGDVWAATEAAIKSIYEGSYWQPWCGKLPAGVDYVFFDECVNAGAGEAAKVLQRALGVAADGHIGVVTMAAVAAAKPADLIARMSDERMRVYRAIVATHPALQKFMRGWTNRVTFCKQKALTLL